MHSKISMSQRQSPDDDLQDDQNTLKKNFEEQKRYQNIYKWMYS